MRWDDAKRRKKSSCFTWRKSSMPGIPTFHVELSDISELGFRLHLGEEELSLSFADFPWFKAATPQQLCEVQQPSADHLYWPSLDIDISISSIRDPSAFPLLAAARV
ncbi:MAG: DUF2442 domain-containing protein [Pseudomonadota bacterium]